MYVAYLDKSIVVFLVAFVLAANGQLPDGIYTLAFQGPGPFQGKGLNFDQSANFNGFPGTAFIGAPTAQSSALWEIKSSADEPGYFYLSTYDLSPCCKGYLGYSGKPCKSPIVDLSTSYQRWMLVPAQQGFFQIYAADPVGNCKPGQNGPLGPSTRSQPPYAGLQLQQPGPLTAGLVWILTRVDPAPLRPSCKRSKGVGTWYGKNAASHLLHINVGWYYTWTLTPDEAHVWAPACIEFVSMIPNTSYATPDQLSKAQSNLLLTFNEPDNPKYANIRVEEALWFWPMFMKTGKRLSSPAGARDILKPGSWIDTFMKESTARGYRVDFIAVHYYGQNTRAWSNITGAVEDMRIYLDAVFAKYQKPLWITEWCLVKWAWGHGDNVYPSFEAQAKFAKAAAEMLDTLPYVEQYAYFSMTSFEPDATSFLYYANGSITPVGWAYRQIAVK